MTIFQPPCTRCEEVTDGQWQQALPCAACIPIRVFKQLQFDPEGELEDRDIPGLLTLAAGCADDPMVRRLLERARARLQSGVASSQDLLQRVERLLNHAGSRSATLGAGPTTPRSRRQDGR